MPVAAATQRTQPSSEPKITRPASDTGILRVLRLSTMSPLGVIVAFVTATENRHSASATFWFTVPVVAGLLLLSLAAWGRIRRSGDRRYGLGFHLHPTGDGVRLEGYDAGVSFGSVHQPSSSITYTVISNWSGGAWPIARLLRDRLGT